MGIFTLSAALGVSACEPDVVRPRHPRPPAPAVAPPPAPAPPAEPPPVEYPMAPKGVVIDTLHGVRVPDPYRWLEDMGSEPSRAWLGAEANFTRRWFEGVPGREKIGQQLAAAQNFERTWPPRRAGSRWFFVRNTGLQDQPVLYVADSATGEGRPVVDFNQVSPDGRLAFAGVRVSPRGTYVAYGLSQGGSDWVEWRVREVATGRDLPDRAEWTKYYAPSWTIDEKGFYYSAFPRPPVGQEITVKDLNCRVRLHRLGADASTDAVVYESSEHPTWQFEPHVTEDGRYLVITTGDGQVGDRGVEEIHVLDVGARRTKFVPIAEGFDAEYEFVTNEGPTFFFRTTSGAPRGRVVAVDLRSPSRPGWKTVIAPGEAVLGAVARAGDRLLAQTLVDASSRLYAYKLDGRGKAVEIALPGVGTAFPVTMPRDERSAVYLYMSYEVPPTTYRYDFASGASEPLRRPKAAVDPGGLETRRVFYAGKDGTKVPMFLVHKKGLAADGNNPTYLTGYGGFGISMTPAYDPTFAWWLSVGGVLAVPCVRGGGEYGEEWAKAAAKTKKQVSFDDFIAAAEYLVAQKITSPKRLAIAGGSNGGLLVAAAATQRPELFGAVVVEAGVLDMLRFHLAGQGEGWAGAYGSPDVPEEFRALYAYSPVHNAKPGVRYPATLVVTGENDGRVAPWHSYKFVAALQAAQAGRAPVLLYLESMAGHSGGTTLAAALRTKADKFGFLMKALEVPPPP